MKKMMIVLVVLTALLLGCNDSKKDVVDSYLTCTNSSDTKTLASLLDDRFILVFLGDKIDKSSFLNSLSADTIVPFRNELEKYTVLNDSVIETVEVSTNIFISSTDLIPPFKVRKKYFVKDDKIKMIVSDTLVGYQVTNRILDYVVRDFLSWVTLNNIDLEGNHSSQFLANTVSQFYSNYSLNEIIRNMKYLTDPFVEFLKSYEYVDNYSRMSFEEAFNRIAGLEGDVKWSSFVPEKYVANSNIKAVEIFINRNKEGSKYQTIHLQYLVNPKNKVAELKYGEVNGKSVSIFDMAMTLALLLETGSYL